MRRAQSNKSSASILALTPLESTRHSFVSTIDIENKKSLLFLDNFHPIRLGVLTFPLFGALVLAAILFYYHSISFLGHSYFLSLFGIGVEQVSLSGHRSTSDADIFEILQLEKATSFINLNASEYENRLKGLPWVKEANIKRIWPNQIALKIKERVPFGMWELESQAFLIDEEGKSLGPIKKNVDLKLPMFSGEGANAHAVEFWSLTQSYPQIKDRIHYAKFINNRRWSVKLKDGAIIDLPMGSEREAISLLFSYDNLATLLYEPSCILDLRFSRRIILRANPIAKQGVCSAKSTNENKKK